MKSIIFCLSYLSAIVIAKPVSLRRDQTFADCLGAANVPVNFANSPNFDTLKTPFNLRTPFTPLVITLPTTSQHVAATIKCATAHSLRVTARGGGHSYAAFGLGGEDGHVIVDLQMMHDVVYDSTSTIATVGGGARLGNIAQAIYDQGKRALPHGTCPGVGIGGHSTHGGHGNQGRMWGLALDQILSVEVVTASGNIVTASYTQNTDLFWGLRGAAPNFGIITTFKFKTYPAPETNTIYSYKWDGMSASTAASNFLAIQKWVQSSAPKELSMGVSLFQGTGSQFEVSGVYNGHTQQQFLALWATLLNTLPPPTSSTYREANWINTLLNFAGQATLSVAATNYNDHNTFYAKSLVTPESNPLSLGSMTSFFNYANNAGPSASQQNYWFVIINLYGGLESAISNTTLLQTSSYAHRSALWTWQFYSNTNTDLGAQNKTIGFLNGFVSSVKRAGDAAYINFVDPTLSRDESHALYYDGVYTKLRDLKVKWDKNHLFYWPQSI